MFLNHTTSSVNYIQKHRDIALLLDVALCKGEKLTYRRLLQMQKSYKGIGGIHRFIKYCKRLGMATDII